MIDSKHSLKSLKVADAMAAHLVTISAHSTMSEAADILCEHQISGAPVVDERKKCIGVISSSDFVHSKAEELETFFAHESLTADRPGRSAGVHTSDLVRSHMTPIVKTVVYDGSLLDAARCMCQEHIHRLVVTDEQSQPIGMLTSLDLVATLISAVDE